jgi:hypothetical protein
MLADMRPLLALIALVAAPAAAQTVPPPPAVVVLQPAPVQFANPVAAYVTAGQDEPGYRSWYLALPTRGVAVASFNAYLNQYGVGGIVPTWMLLRTASSWERCGAQPFEVPPTSEWPNLVQTLRYVRDYVVPAVGPVEPVSAYRNPVLNVCAGGAPESAHKHYSAIDLVPLRPTTREELMQTLCGVHARRGPAYGVGLGFYAYLRFHVDTTKFRRWNMDPAVASHCPPIIKPEDIASVALPPPAPDSAAEAAAQVAQPQPQPAVSTIAGPVVQPDEPVPQSR